MPILAIFFGIIVRVFHGDHPPPHIHVQYGEYMAIVDIRSGKTLKGKLPGRVGKILREWLTLRRKEVLKGWREAQEYQTPSRIKPLE